MERLVKQDEPVPEDQQEAEGLLARLVVPVKLELLALLGNVDNPEIVADQERLVQPDRRVNGVPLGQLDAQAQRVLLVLVEKLENAANLDKLEDLENLVVKEHLVCMNRPITDTNLY